MSAAEKTYEGQCYCGAVKVSVTGEPAGAGYCHCKSCRSWSPARSMHSPFGRRTPSR